MKEVTISLDLLKPNDDGKGLNRDLQTDDSRQRAGSRTSFAEENGQVKPGSTESLKSAKNDNAPQSDDSKQKLEESTLEKPRIEKPSQGSSGETEKKQANVDR